MPVLPKSTPPGASTGTLELKATKENAHSKSITSVAFNPVDGNTIVSGSWDKTIKVWDAINFRPLHLSEWEEVDISAMPKSIWRKVEIKGLGKIKENYWKNNVTGWIQESKPSAGAPVVGTIKVWGE